MFSQWKHLDSVGLSALNLAKSSPVSQLCHWLSVQFFFLYSIVCDVPLVKDIGDNWAYVKKTYAP